MTIKLQSIALHNFKGIRDLEVTFNGNDATISGENGAGKTTIVDAFLWLLFGKDSENRGQFEIKTLDENNNPIHNLEHEVEAVLSVDGRKVTLRKLYKEIWKRTRGKSEQVFDGHTTDYWINEEPTKAKDFSVYVSDLIDEDKFKLITNPLFFSLKLHWEDRRKTLLALCGELTPESIIAAGGEDLEGLEELLEGRTVDSVRKIVMDKRRASNDELNKIPAQIEAVSRTLPAMDIDYSSAEKELEKCKADIADLDTQAQSASKALDSIREKGRELVRLESESNTLKMRLERESSSGYEDAKAKRESMERQLQAADTESQAVKASIKHQRERKIEAEEDLKKLRDDYDAELTTSFSEPAADDLICKSCGQDLPLAKRTEMVTAARDRFDSEKASNLKTIEAKGLRAKESFENIEKGLATLTSNYDSILENAQKIKGELDIYKMTEEALSKPGTIDVSANPEFLTLASQITALKAELDQPRDDATDEIARKRAEVNQRQSELMKTLAERDASTKSQLEINNLTSRERQVSDQVAEYDGQLYMIDTYVRTEAELLEGNINAKFKTIKFKLFKEQVNGGLQPTCEALIGGVPFSEANTAGQFNAGMEIIDALCEHYGVNAPVFVDRCESINVLTPISSQVVQMRVLNESDWRIAAKDPETTVSKGARKELCIETYNKI